MGLTHSQRFRCQRNRMRSALKRRRSSICVRLRCESRVGSLQSLKPCVIRQQEAKGGSVIEGWGKPKAVRPRDNGPIFLVPIRIADESIQDEIASEHVPCCEALGHRNRRIDSHKGNLHSRQGVAHPTPACQRVREQLVASDEFFTFPATRVVRSEDLPANYPEVLAPAIALDCQLGMRRGNPKTLSYAIRHALRPIITFRIFGTGCVAIVGDVLHQPTFARFWVSKPLLGFRAEGLVSSVRPV